MKIIASVVLALLLSATIVLAQEKSVQHSPSQPSATAGTYRPVTEYDPKRDATADIKDAIAEAGRTSRNVLVEVGGKWCVWCGYLDKFFDQNSTLRDFRDANYVMVKVNWSPENKNEKVLASYPAIPGYPHIFVLDKTGKLLHSQDTSKLEEGRGYNMKSIADFLQQWAPKK